MSSTVVSIFRLVWNGMSSAHEVDPVRSRHCHRVDGVGFEVFLSRVARERRKKTAALEALFHFDRAARAAPLSYFTSTRSPE